MTLFHTSLFPASAFPRLASLLSDSWRVSSLERLFSPSVPFPEAFPRRRAPLSVPFPSLCLPSSGPFLSSHEATAFSAVFFSGIFCPIPFGGSAFFLCSPLPWTFGPPITFFLFYLRAMETFPTADLFSFLRLLLWPSETPASLTIVVTFSQ